MLKKKAIAKKCLKGRLLDLISLLTTFFIFTIQQKAVSNKTFAVHFPLLFQWTVAATFNEAGNFYEPVNLFRDLIL